MQAFSLDSERRRIVIVVAGGLGLLLGYALALGFKALAVEVPWWVNLPGPLGISGGLYFVFERWLWRLKQLQKLLGVPDLNGVWAAELRSSHDQHVLIHKGTAIVAQTWSRLVIDFETSKSRSRSTCAAVFLERGASPEIEYGYKNEPKADATPSMNASTGFSVLRLETPDLLVGEYFTGRGRERHGTIRLVRGAA